MLYPVIVLLLIAISAVWGFRRGLARQTPAVIGTAFGIICTHILTPGLNEVMQGAFTMVHGHPEEKFVYDTISSAIIFISIYLIFRTVTFFLANVFNMENSTILDNLEGGAVRAVQEYAHSLHNTQSHSGAQYQVEPAAHGAFERWQYRV